MYARINGNKRNGTNDHDGTRDPIDAPIVPGYCGCGRPSGRTGKCATCDSNDRRVARKISTNSNKTRKWKSLPKRTKKRMALDAEYSRERASWLPGKKCAVFPHLDATEVHHKKGRVGYADKEKRRLGIPLLLDKDYWLPTSHKGHEKITKESAWAELMGFTVKRSN
jgi:hypothetical protein